MQVKLYKMGKGDQGVLLVEPYKSEILSFWKFKTPADTKKSTAAIKNFFKHLSNKMILGEPCSEANDLHQ